MHLGKISGAVALVVGLGCAPATPTQRMPATALVASAARSAHSKKPGFTAVVMAPLWIPNEDAWRAFGDHLQTVKSYGVGAVSMDVWWGLVEKQKDNQFDWSYYNRLFREVKSKGLRLVPILSFHQCGGNVGDDCDVPLPAWLWEKYRGRTLNHVVIDADDLKYKSEQGNYSREAVQVWADELVVNEYQEFAAAFRQNFVSEYGRDVQEINVSLGPAGELRYPSYNGHDRDSGYPTRGALQAHSKLAGESFRSRMLSPEKYGSLQAINAAWNTKLTSESQIRPPDDRDQFFTSQSYRNTTYGKDFVDWYNQSLVDHGKRVLSAVGGALGEAFAGAPLGYKVPGVHWAMTHPSYPRAAEVAAGLVQTSTNMDADATGHGYHNIVGLAKQAATPNRAVVLHFTCLEMNDQSGANAYSLAKSLVFWVAQEAQRQEVTVKGENALADGVKNHDGWNNITNAFDWSSYAGLTVLRVNDVASGIGRDRYASFIERYR